MKITEAITVQLMEAFEGGNWTDVDVTHTLQDVNLHEATLRTKASPNTIASLLYHIGFYNSVIVQRLEGEQPEIDANNGFNMPELHTEKDWKELRENVMRSAKELAHAILSLDEEKLSEPINQGGSRIYKSVHGVIEHTYYHLGQIVVLKNLIRNQKNKSTGL